MISDFPILYTVPQNYIPFNYCPIFQFHYIKKKNRKRFFISIFSSDGHLNFNNSVELKLQIIFSFRVPVIALLPNHHYVLCRRNPSLSSFSKFSDIVDLSLESFSSFTPPDTQGHPFISPFSPFSYHLEKGRGGEEESTAEKNVQCNKTKKQHYELQFWSHIVNHE